MARESELRKEAASRLLREFNSSELSSEASVDKTRSQSCTPPFTGESVESVSACDSLPTSGAAPQQASTQNQRFSSTPCHDASQTSETTALNAPAAASKDECKCRGKGCQRYKATALAVAGLVVILYRALPNFGRTFVSCLQPHMSPPHPISPPHAQLTLSSDGRQSAAGDGPAHATAAGGGRHRDEGANSGGAITDERGLLLGSADVSEQESPLRRLHASGHSHGVENVQKTGPPLAHRSERAHSLPTSATPASAEPAASELQTRSTGFTPVEDTGNHSATHAENFPRQSYAHLPNADDEPPQPLNDLPGLFSGDLEGNRAEDDDMSGILKGLERKCRD